MNVIEQMRMTVRKHDMASDVTPVLLMVSGGSDSTALAYAAAELRDEGTLGALAMLHVNHELRGADSDADERFVEKLASELAIPFTCEAIDVAAIAREEGGNVEAVARRERYAAAQEALAELCRRESVPVAQGRIFVAHTADDRVENFYMRSIVGTGPGGFRSMRYANGQVMRPLLDCGREDLRGYVIGRIERELPVVRDGDESLWREDATNAHTDRFRAYVRHEIIPRAEERNPQLLATLTRSMNLIGDEDDMLDDIANTLFEQLVVWLEPAEEGCVLSPLLIAERTPMQRRVVMKALERFLGADERIDTSTVEAVLAGIGKSGYVANVQGNLAVSANKNGVRIEPMAAFRTRRKRG
ncbi:MAG: tRNA lysidine(34) synthetase TilS [Eggerthellaceae bacterium]|nr:tRNA lysidine(34) synthetase TilS [Eggerthellaceae bacterium]